MEPAKILRHLRVRFSFKLQCQFEGWLNLSAFTVNVHAHTHSAIIRVCWTSIPTVARWRNAFSDANAFINCQTTLRREASLLPLEGTMQQLFYRLDGRRGCLWALIPVLRPLSTAWRRNSRERALKLLQLLNATVLPRVSVFLDVLPALMVWHHMSVRVRMLFGSWRETRTMNHDLMICMSFVICCSGWYGLKTIQGGLLSHRQ